jgi:beta-barrel assembly-enhancing protease
MIRTFTALILPLAAALLAGCGVNPVTGSSEMSFVSEADEVRIGNAQYGPSQQSEGGLYSVDPQLTEYVRKAGMSLARVSERPELPFEFVVLNNSVPNAWALPGGKIALNRGLLLQLQDESELAAVLGHEIVHAVARHGAQQQEKGTLLNIGMAVLGVATAGTGLQDLAMQGAQIGGALIQTRYGRADELEADHYGMEYMSRAGYNPQGAVRLQETFVRLSAGREQGGFSALFASHPPSQERVDANRRTLKELGSAGRDGRAEFQRAMARLNRDKPAYEAYDKGVAAINKRDYPQALRYAQQAIKLQEREPAFHELAGVAYLRLDRPVDAIKDLNRSVALQQTYYRPYLLRGMLHLKGNNLDVAKQDLSVSNRLLPTADATFGLGEIAEREGDAQTAMRYYDAVARSQSNLAAEARNRVARLRTGSGYYR